MALPLIAVISTIAWGAKKTYDAHKKNKQAEKIVRKAKKRFEEAQELLEIERDTLNNRLDEFAQYKLNIFGTHISNLVNLIAKCKKNTSSTLSIENIFSDNELKELKISVDNSLEISSSLAQGTASGVLTAFGAYGSIGLLATASTGTAISTLSGAAATNATLAWLGGGSLAAGGMGVAGGTAVLGGLVAGPALLVAGFVMDSKAEENLTEAEDFSAKIDIDIEKIHFSIEGYKQLTNRVDELQSNIENVSMRFIEQYDKLINPNFITKLLRLFGISTICNKEEQIKTLMVIGKQLKNLLDISLIDENGEANESFGVELKNAYNTTVKLQG